MEGPGIDPRHIEPGTLDNQIDQSQKEEEPHKLILGRQQEARPHDPTTARHVEQAARKMQVVSLRSC